MKTMDPELRGRVALVTGAGGAIGDACAYKLFRCGADVGVADIDLDAAQGVAANVDSSGSKVHAMRVDVTDPESVLRMVEETVDHFGSLSIAVNCAGVAGPLVAMADYPIEAWRQCLSVNVDGMFYCLKAEVGAMRNGNGGSIINMGSILGLRGFRGAAAYTTSKHGVVGLTRVAAVDHANDNIRVNVVCPGFIDTPLLDRNLGNEDKMALRIQHAMNRLGTAVEVAELVAWLASDAASFVTGGDYAVDGGFLAF